MSENVVDLRKRVKELRGSIVGSLASAGVEELKKEIAYHEAAAKSAERDKKRMEALAKAREAKIAKSKAKKAEVAPVEKKRKAEKAAEGEPKPKKAKVAAVEEVVLTKNIRAKKVKNDSEDE